MSDRPPVLPTRFPDRDQVAAVRGEADALEAGAESAETRRLAGRVLARRGHGKLVFLDLVDRSGRIQLLCPADRTGPVDLDLGDVVGAIGKPTKTRRGEPSLVVDELVLLAKNERPLPDTFHGVVDPETRYRKRHLDLLVNEETRRDFELRARMITAIRRRLDDDGFVEVETPVLQPRYGGAFAEPFVTHSNELDRDLYLRIATELYLKRLIVGGLERVYEIGKDFRNESVSYKHQPEFTMLEWYEAYAGYRDTMVRIEELVAGVALDTLGTTRVTFRGHEVDLATPWQRLSLVDALSELGLWTRDEADLRARLVERGVDTEADRSWAQLVDHALGHFVEPELIQPTILHDYPVELSPFARTTADDPAITERFEYYAAGMELGNAYSEINEAGEQARRFAEQAAVTGGVQGDPDYVEALSYGMPPTGGLGLGIDRLAMLLTGRETIRDVILFPRRFVSTPEVTVVMPVRNEAAGIEAALDSVLAQELDAPFELVVADGRSDDGTAELLAARAESDPRLRVVDNPGRGIPQGLNAALAAARGRYLVRLDGHATMGPGYAAGLVAHLRSGECEAAGGRIEAVGEGAFGRAVAAAHGSRFGIGNASHHYRSEPALIDHVSYGSYVTERLRAVGGWDERFARNEDYELNFRYRAAGGRILLDPAIVSSWRVRETPAALARQYAAYGWWRLRTLARHPSSLSVRWLVPPALVLALVLGAAFAWTGWGRLLLAATALAYLLFVAAGAVALARAAGWRLAGHAAVALAVMHLAWGAGFLASALALPLRRPTRA